MLIKKLFGKKITPQYLAEMEALLPELDRAYAKVGLGEWLPKIKEMLDYGDVDGLIKALYSNWTLDKSGRLESQ